MSRLNTAEAPYVIPPEGGWKGSTWYKVRVAYNKSNPVHFALFFSGFLSEGEGSDGPQPLQYNHVHGSTSGSENVPLRELYYLEVIEELWCERDESIHMKYMLPDTLIEQAENLNNRNKG